MALESRDTVHLTKRCG